MRLKYTGEIAVVILAIIVSAMIPLPFSLAIGDSMLPNFNDWDWLWVDRSYDDLQRGDVVCVQSNMRYKWIPLKIKLLKRVVGLPGEHIAIYDGQVYIDKMPITEDYLYEPYTDGILFDTLNVNEYFVMGDNRLASRDSRSVLIGRVTEDMILSKITGKLFSPTCITNLWRDNDA